MNNNKVLHLLILRVIPLLIRPFVVLAEGLYLDNSNVIVTVLPIAMLTLILSSIPVHLDYYRSNPKQLNYANVKLTYISALTWILILSTITLLLVLLLIPIKIQTSIIAIIFLTFLIEKMSDETSRKLEFQKKFFSWFNVQVFRSAWMLIPIITGLAGFNYINSFLIAALIASGFMTAIFIHVNNITPKIDYDGLLHIRNNLVFLTGNFFPATLQQLPRIIVSHVFPQYAHLYLAIAQFCQGTGLLYNVRFQIPYRKIIARHPAMFQRRMFPFTKKIMLGIIITAAIYTFCGKIIFLENHSNIVIGLLLIPILIAESLSFVITTTYLGYVQWFAKKVEAAVIYVLCLLAGLIIASATYFTSLLDYVTILSLPPIIILLGSTWVFVIYGYLFSKKLTPIQNKTT